MPLSLRLREATQALHRETERAGIMPALLRGQLPRPRYVALLAQLEALYAALEAGLARPGALALDPRLRRLPSLRADLAHLAGAVPPAALAPTRAYAAALAALPPPWLAAHAYVRYLGDLAGGQVLARIVGRAYGLADQGLAFYRFEGEPAVLAHGLRAQLDALPADQGDALVAQAQDGFRRHVEIFETLAAPNPI
jgi:heme oxygenase